jgi:transcriptional regulator with XRE-family HTH domain
MVVFFIWRYVMSRMGSEISRLRKEIGLTQKQLAKLVGVSEGYIIDVEAGKKVLNGELAAKISKALRKEVGSLDIYEDSERNSKPEPDRKVVKVIEKPVQAVWTDALAGVLAQVPIYDYKMEKSITFRQMPIVNNKIEGFAKDKVFYLTIEDNEMSGFRILKGDLAFACAAQEIEKDAIYLIDYNGRKSIRQIKKLDGEKLLIVSNSGSLITETASRKDVKVVARLVRLELEL